MTDPEYSEEKNEQELNLFAEQPHPEAPSAGPESESADNAPRDAGAPAEESRPVQEAATISDPDDVPVVAPPPRKQPSAPARPGIVSPPRSESRTPPPAAAVSTDETDARKPSSHAIRQDQTLGEALTSIRKAGGLSIEEVATITRIRSEYIAELESGKLMDSLPSVYISAYVRKLIEVYELSAEDSELLIEKMHGEMPQVQEEIPDKLLENVNEGGLVNEGEIKRMRNITIVFFVFVGAVVLAVIWLIILVFIRHSPAPSSPGTSDVSRQASEPVSQTIVLDESELEALIGPETPSISVMKMSKTPAVRDTP